MDLREVQIIELFHVAFLDALQQRLERGRWILKGGANLRYFFDSQRYSQDIDLDFLGDAPWGVREKVGEVIKSPVLSNLLRVKGLPLRSRVSTSRAIPPDVGRSGLLRPATVSWCEPKSSSVVAGLTIVFRPRPCRIRSSPPTRCGRRLSSTTRSPPRPSRRSPPWPGARRSSRVTSSTLTCCCVAGSCPRARSTSTCSPTQQRSRSRFPSTPSMITYSTSSADLHDYYDSEERWVQMQTFVAEQLEAAR